MSSSGIQPRSTSTARSLPAMRSGVSEFLSEPLQDAEIEAAMTRLAAKRVGKDTAQVFAFVGAKGGVGTTTLAVNIAATLGIAAPGRTILLDLHLMGGDAAVYLGLDPKFSIVDAYGTVSSNDGDTGKAYLNSHLYVVDYEIFDTKDADEKIKSAIEANGAPLPLMRRNRWNPSSMPDAIPPAVTMRPASTTRARLMRHRGAISARRSMGTFPRPDAST